MPPISLQRIPYGIMCSCLAVALLWLNGCAGVSELPVAKLRLSVEEESRLGAAVAPRLLQLLGGPYHDRRLLADLGRLAARSGEPRLTLAVADRSEPALYALPGRRIILSRGLLAGVGNVEELSALLTRAHVVYAGELPRSMADAVRALGFGPADPFDPAAADIRLAVAFADRPCVEDCLTAGRLSGSGAVPESVARLKRLQPGYDRLARAQEVEATGDVAQAIALMLQAAADTPDEPLLLGALGMAYLRAGQLQSARLHLQKSVKLQPDYYRTQMGLGYLYLQLQRYADARSALTRSISLLPVAENLFLLGEVYENTGESVKAADCYRRVVLHDGGSKLGREAQERLAKLGGRQ